MKTGWMDKLYDVLFPPFCLICGRSGRYICNDCELFLIEVGSVPIRSNNIDRLIVIWEKNILTDRIFKKVFHEKSGHIFHFFVDKALFFLTKDESYRDFWSAWFSTSTKIWPCSTSDLTFQNKLIINKLISLTDRHQNQIDHEIKEKSAILISPFFCPDIEIKAKEVKELGFQKIWSLVLVG